MPRRKKWPLLSPEELQSAGQRFYALERDEGTTEVQAESRDIVLAENISLVDYLRYVDSEPMLPVKIRLEDGKVIGYDVSGYSRASTMGSTISSFTKWGKDHDLICAVSVDTIVWANSVFCPISIYPRKRPRRPAAQAAGMAIIHVLIVSFRPKS